MWSSGAIQFWFFFSECNNNKLIAQRHELSCQLKWQDLKIICPAKLDSCCLDLISSKIWWCSLDNIWVTYFWLVSPRACIYLVETYGTNFVSTYQCIYWPAVPVKWPVQVIFYAIALVDYMFPWVFLQPSSGRPPSRWALAMGMKPLNYGKTIGPAMVDLNAPLTPPWNVGGPIKA